MSDGKCWTLPQKVLDNECRIKKLEEKDVEINEALNNKLNKITTESEHIRLYGITAAGLNRAFNAASEVEEHTVPIRGENGVIKVGEPIENDDAVNLGYPSMQFSKGEYEKSKNLFRFDTTRSFTKNGITYNYLKGTNYISVSGTSTAVTNAWNSEFDDVVLPAGSYTLKIRFEGTGSINYCRFAQGDSTPSNRLSTSTNSVNYIASNSINLYDVQFPSGITFTNFKIYLGVFEGVDYQGPLTYYYGPIVHTQDIEPVLLWSNPNQSSALTSLSVTNMNSMANYEYLVIQYKDYISHGYKYIKVKRGGYNYRIYCVTEVSGTVVSITRVITFTSNTSFNIEEDKTSTSIGGKDSFLVPTAIYGTNLL